PDDRHPDQSFNDGGWHDLVPGHPKRAGRLWHLRRRIAGAARRESHATRLDRNELGALRVAAGLGPPAEHALISLLALNGLRVSEVVTIPLAPRTTRAIDLAIGERTDGPVFLTAAGVRLDRHGAARIVRPLPAGPGSSSASGR